MHFAVQGIGDEPHGIPRAKAGLTGAQSQTWLGGAQAQAREVTCYKDKRGVLQWHWQREHVEPGAG